MNREEVESASLETVLRAYPQGPEAVSHASLALVLHHMRGADAVSLTVLSAWVPGRARQQNIEAHSRLVQHLKSASIEFHRLDGVWEFDNSAGCTNKRRQPLLFVFDLEQPLATKLSSRWCADAPLLWLGPGAGEDVMLLSPADGRILQVGKFTHEMIMAAMTGSCKKQTFLGFEFRPCTWIGRMAEVAVFNADHQNS